METIFLAALVAGVLGSPHCIGMCGGFALACGRTGPGAAAWHLGRLFTYGLLGAGAGWVGGSLPGPWWIAHLVAGVLLLLFSARLAGLLPEVRLPVGGGLARQGGRLLAAPGDGAKLAFGVLNGFLPCGLVYTALALPLSTGTPAQGAATMVVFGLGTVPALALATVGLRRLYTVPRARRWLAAGVLTAGVAALVVRIPAEEPGAAPECHATP